MPIPLVLFGIIYLGKIIPVLAMLAVGLVLGSQRIRMIPVEFQLFLKASRDKDLTPRSAENLRATGKANEKEEEVSSRE